MLSQPLDTFRGAALVFVGRSDGPAAIARGDSAPYRHRTEGVLTVFFLSQAADLAEEKDPERSRKRLTVFWSENGMLTDAELRNTRGKTKPYKKTDRDGLYVLVTPSGGIALKYDYRFNGRRETVTFGSYGLTGLSLARAREKLIEAKRMIAEGVSPALEKQRAKRRLREARDFAHVAQKWMEEALMADSTRNMRHSIFNREVLPQWRNRQLGEITPDDLRAHCKSIVERGAPATAIHVRDIIKQIYAWAILHGEKIDNPADGVAPAAIARFRPRDRSLSPSEIRIMFGLLGEVATLPTIRLGLKFILLSMVR